MLATFHAEISHLVWSANKMTGLLHEMQHWPERVEQYEKCWEVLDSWEPHVLLLDYTKAKVLGYLAIYEKIHLSCYASAIFSENPAISVVLTYPNSIQLLLFALPLTREYLEENMEYNLNLVSTSCHYPSLFIRFRIHKNLPYHTGLILCKNK